MSDPPEVSVVIPTRDRWPLLSAHAVPTALGQEGVALELIVVDDGSTDGTSARLAEHGDARLRVVRHESPRGVAAARNAGIAAARGDWVAFLDDDDLWSPRKLRAQLDLASATGADAVFAAAVLVNLDSGNVLADVYPDEGALARTLLFENVVPGGCSNVIASASLLRVVGGFDETLAYTEDWDLWIRLAKAGSFASCPDVLVAHVEHRANALFRYRPDVLAEVERVLVKHSPELDSSRLRSLRLAALEWMAHEYLRGGFRIEATRVLLQLARERRSAKDVGRAALALSGPSVARFSRRLLQRAGPGPLEPARASAAGAPPWLDTLAVLPRARPHGR